MRGRPRGDANRLKRLRAFELYVGGNKKSEIANTLGVTKASVSAWAKKDLWQDRLSQIAARAGESVDHVLGETIAGIAERIRGKYQQRLAELDHICVSSLTPPQARISAIKAWFEIGNKIQVDPTKPLTDPRNLELIQDLLEAPQPDPAAGEPDRIRPIASGSTASGPTDPR